MKTISLRIASMATICGAALLFLSSAPAQAEKRKVSGSAREVAQPSYSTPYAKDAPKREINQRVAEFRGGSTRLDKKCGFVKCRTAAREFSHGGARVAHATHTSARRGGKPNSKIHAAVGVGFSSDWPGRPRCRKSRPDRKR
jgi:hypothetical protein